jgi:hypothetical protein
MLICFELSMLVHSVWTCTEEVHRSNFGPLPGPLIEVYRGFPQFSLVNTGYITSKYRPRINEHSPISFHNTL